jgi:hypothetical protein
VAFALAAMSAAAMVLLAAHPYFDGRRELFYLFAVAGVLSALLAVYELFVIRAKVRLGEVRPHGAILAILAIPLGTVVAWFMSLFFGVTTYASTYMGRRHRVGRKTYAAISAPGAGWLLPGEVPDLGATGEAAAALGAEWRSNALKEHASVAAFSHLALDLMAVGAPRELIQAAQHDALDETDHVAICLSIACAFDGRTEGPAPFPEARKQKRLRTRVRDVALAQIALDALADGVLNEGVAARLLAKLSLVAVTPWLAVRLRQMAHDESRHAQHSWDIVLWCLREGGETVRAALRGALNTLPRQIEPSSPPDARAGEWLPWGVHDLAMEREAFTKTREHVRSRLAELCESTSGDAVRGFAA